MMNDESKKNQFIICSKNATSDLDVAFFLHKTLKNHQNTEGVL